MGVRTTAAGLFMGVRAMALLPDGRVLLAGETTTPSGSSDWAITRVWP